MSYDRLFTQFDLLHQNASVASVYGEPIQAEGKVIVPVAVVSYGFGLGVGEGPSNEGAAPTAGGGGGGGLTAKPVAIIEITPERTRVESIVDEQLIALAGIAFAAWAVLWIAAALIRIWGKPRA